MRGFITALVLCIFSIIFGAPVKSMIGAYGISSVNEESDIVEVEYLESTGTQYIDTGLDYFPDFQIDCSGKANYPVFGVANNNRNFLGRWSPIEPVWQLVVNQSMIASSTLVNERHLVSLVESVFAIDGNVVGTYSNRAWVYELPNLTLFSIGTTSYRGIIYSCRLFAMDGVLIRDFIPVRFTNEQGMNEGAMYDLVSKQLFRNAGSGKFLIGPDRR